MIGIDSMILIYAHLVPKKEGKNPTERSELALRAQLLLYMQSKGMIVLPTIVVSEVLVPVPADHRNTLIAKLSSRFICAPFDLPAAAIAADLWTEHKKLPDELRYDERHVLRADAMIVATAKSAGATDFYSHDRKCRALADIVMTSHDLPTRDPNDMFLRSDIERGEV